MKLLQNHFSEALWNDDFISDHDDVILDVNVVTQRPVAVKILVQVASPRRPTIQMFLSHSLYYTVCSSGGFQLAECSLTQSICGLISAQRSL